MYLFQEKIGYGGSSEVFSAIHLQTNRQVAIKVDRSPLPYRKTRLEAAVIRDLHSLRKQKGIPTVYRVEQGRDYSFLVMKRLGPSLQDVFLNCNRNLSIRTIQTLCIQILDRIKLIHDHGYIHCDLKPDNLLFGCKTSLKTLYIIDFGLCQRYRDTEGLHRPDGLSTHFTGSLRFSSINAHRGFRLSRRDDMESFCYILFYLLSGSLPWLDLADDADQILRRKETLFSNSETVPERCSANLLEILATTRSMQFEERPDYRLYYETVQTLNK